MTPLGEYNQVIIHQSRYSRRYVDLVIAFYTLPVKKRDERTKVSRVYRIRQT